MREKEKFALAIAVIVAGQQTWSAIQNPEQTKGDSIPLAAVAHLSSATHSGFVDVSAAVKIDTITDAPYSIPPAVKPIPTAKG